MEIYLGRNLSPTEVVHHKDHDKTNNMLENLELLGHGQHTITHHIGIKRSDKTKSLISQNRTGRLEYNRHPAYKHVTPDDLRQGLTAKGTVAGASIYLGISPATFRSKLKYYNIKKEQLWQA